MDLESWLAGNVALGLALAALVVALLAAGRSFLREIADDPDPAWRAILRLAAVLVAVFIAWTTLFDRWRQLVDEPVRLLKRFPSQRVVLDPTPEALRAVTLVLLVLSLIPVAALFARHVGGYALQLVLLLSATIFWAPLFAMRRRLDINLALGFGGDVRSPLDLAGYALYLLLDWVTVGALLLASYAILAMLVALPLTLVLDLTRLRHPRTTTEAGAFFAALAGRAAGLDGERDLRVGR